MKVTALYSGGLDSTVLLWFLRAGGDDVEAISFDYGQRHGKEVAAAAEICRLGGFVHHAVDLRAIKLLISVGSQTGDEPVPEGHYAAESMKATIVPNRNMIMLAIAAGRALAARRDAVAYAAHAGDHTIYPDCRPEFIQAIAEALGLADFEELVLSAPFVYMTKAQIVWQGHNLGAPLDLTWSCYKGGAVHCGRCGTCVERREAFKLAGVQDPTSYEPASNA